MDTIYRSETAAHGGSIEAVLAGEVDISGLGASELFRVSDDLKGYSIINAQVVWAGLTGTLNGVATIAQSNDGVNFDDTVSTVTIASADGSSTLEKVDFSGKFAAVNFAKIGLTGGTISIVFIAKRK